MWPERRRQQLPGEEACFDLAAEQSLHCLPPSPSGVKNDEDKHINHLVVTSLLHTLYGLEREGEEGEGGWGGGGREVRG